MKEETQKQVGRILSDKDEAERDAIHVAVVPVFTSDDSMGPGEKVKLCYGTTNQVKRANDGDHVGVIDPFIKKYNIKKGSRVFLFLNPNTVTGMTHNWRHPSFDDVKKTSNPHEDWLRKFADKWNMDYDMMIEGAVEDGGYTVAAGIDLHHRSELDDGDEKLFWHHVEMLTGQKFDDKHKQNFVWSCSC